MEKYVQTHNKGRATRSSCLLRIWTSKLVLLTLLAGWNHLFLRLNNFFLSVTNGKKKGKRKESRTKTCNKRLVYQHLGVDVKSCFSDKKLISTSQWRVEHLFAGQNTQQLSAYNWAPKWLIYPINEVQSDLVWAKTDLGAGLVVFCVCGLSGVLVMNQSICIIMINLKVNSCADNP